MNSTFHDERGGPISMFRDGCEVVKFEDSPDPQTWTHFVAGIDLKVWAVASAGVSSEETRKAETKIAFTFIIFILISTNASGLRG